MFTDPEFQRQKDEEDEKKNSKNDLSEEEDYEHGLTNNVKLSNKDKSSNK